MAGLVAARGWACARARPIGRQHNPRRDGLDTTASDRVQRFILRPFRAAWWLPGSHAQTIFGGVLRGIRPIRYVRERLDTPDGDFLDLDWAEPIPRSSRHTSPTASSSRRTSPIPNSSRETRPIVVLLHGLEGCSESGYMIEAARACTEAGLRAVALNFRGRSGTPNRLPRAYHAGETGDLAHVLEELRRREPGAPLAALGFSLGGNVLLKYLGERGNPAGPALRAAAAVSVPFDLAASTSRMERGMGRLYTRLFLRSLRNGVRAKAAAMPVPYDRDAALEARTLRAFDDAVVAPLHGFRDAADYYAQSSSKRYLEAIRVPTLLLQARDDPFQPASFELQLSMRGNRWLRPGFVESGGHVGFVEGHAPWAARFWAEAEAVRFLATHLLADRPIAATVETSTGTTDIER